MTVVSTITASRASFMVPFYGQSFQDPNGHAGINVDGPERGECVALAKPNEPWSVACT